MPLNVNSNTTIFEQFCPLTRYKTMLFDDLPPHSLDLFDGYVFPCPDDQACSLCQFFRFDFLFRFYKGLPPLRMRQIPYTTMKFACFERTVEAIYKYVMPKPKADCSKAEQFMVTFAAGYIAGVFCAIVSHLADTVVSKLNNDVGITPISAARELE